MDKLEKITNRPSLPKTFENDILSGLVERGNTHGSFERNAKTIQLMKDIAREGDSWRPEGMTRVEREAVDMILHKIGRIVNGDSHYDDHWADIVGYAELVRKENANVNGC